MTTNTPLNPDTSKQVDEILSDILEKAWLARENGIADLRELQQKPKAQLTAIIESAQAQLLRELELILDVRIGHNLCPNDEAGDTCRIKQVLAEIEGKSDG